MKESKKINAEELSEEEFPLSLLRANGVTPIRACRFRDGRGVICEGSDADGFRVPLSLYPPQYMKNPTYFWLGIHAHPDHAASLPKKRVLVPKAADGFNLSGAAELIAEGAKYWKTVEGAAKAKGDGDV